MVLCITAKVKNLKKHTASSKCGRNWVIEFSREGFDDFNPANKALTLSRVIFYGFRVKINGVEWMDTSSEAFKEAWDKAILWRKLQQ